MELFLTSYMKKLYLRTFLYEKVMFFNVFVEKVTFSNFCCIQKVNLNLNHFCPKK